jgi:transketolase
MQGISHEAASLAGVWGLNKLIALYDDNGISIDGAVQGWSHDDTPARFRAHGWQCVGPVDGHDVLPVGQAIAMARASTERPTLAVCHSTIGRGSPGRDGTVKAHGEALGADDIATTRAVLAWTAPPLEVPYNLRALSMPCTSGVGIAGFNESAPAADLYRHFGIDAEAVAAEARRCCAH